MILKYVFLAFLGALLITASDPFYGTSFSLQQLPEDAESDVRDIPWRMTDAFSSYLEDYDDRVDDVFAITSYYQPMVRFWFFIYTQFESNQVVFHDKNDMLLIYKVLDFSSLHAKKLPRNTLYVLQQEITNEKIKEMKQDLAFLAKNPFSLEPRAREIYESIRHAGIALPINQKERQEFFASLSNNLRTQTGQKNFIRNGIVRSLPYQTFLNKYFMAKKLPPELLSIPFLESSFNPLAESKVAALGAWQFMPLIASYFVPKRTDYLDYRSNIGVSSISAAFLLAQNYQILKSWDLAVTAYNSGTKHLLKTKRELASSKVDLEEVIKHSDSKHFGFASKNFYSEFLALAYTLAYREEIFENIHEHDRKDVDDDLQFYLLKCSLRLDKVLSQEQLEELRFHNHHIRDIKRPYSKGVIISSKSSLPPNRFYKLSFDQIVRMKPIDWEKALKGQSCSTR